MQAGASAVRAKRKGAPRYAFSGVKPVGSQQRRTPGHDAAKFLFSLTRRPVAAGLRTFHGRLGVKQLVLRMRDGGTVIGDPMPDDEAAVLAQQNFTAWTDPNPRAAIQAIRVGSQVFRPAQVANMTLIEAGAGLPPSW